MENLLTFLNDKISQSDMTVGEICNKIGISRQKFYRFVKEPRRFSRENIDDLIDILSLNDSEIKRLESYLFRKNQSDITENTSDYNDLIENLLRHKLSEELRPNQYAIEYSQSGRPTTMENPDTLARIMAGIDRRIDVYNNEVHDNHTLSSMKHDYDFTIYNCVSSQVEVEYPKRFELTTGIKIIACVINKLDDIIAGMQTSHIRVRHYLSKDRQIQLNDKSGNTNAVRSQIRFLDEVLPLFSMLEDYSIIQSDGAGAFWAEHSSFCLVKHTCGVCSKESLSMPNSATNTSSYTEFYILAFSDDKNCRACRLGEDELSHIYNFCSPDSYRVCDSYETTSTVSPNQIAYESDKNYRCLLFHQDLCFDDIPKQMWLALYEDVCNKRDNTVYIKAFRKLMDPHDQYAFLNFEDLVLAAIQTLEQRYEASKQKGKIVICHPQGLLNMVQTGMISDLSAEWIDNRESYQNMVQLRFPPHMIKELLEMMKKGILDRMAVDTQYPNEYNGINYYILHPQYPFPDVSFTVYYGRGVIPIYAESRHRHLITALYENPAVSTVLFHYFIKEMIEKRGEKLGTAILSDEHSVALIDKLIANLDGKNDW